MIRAEVMAFYQAKGLDGDRGLIDTLELARSNAVGTRQRAERHRAAAAEADKVAVECATADDAARTLALTDKDREALAVFDAEKVRQK